MNIKANIKGLVEVIIIGKTIVEGKTAFLCGYTLGNKAVLDGII